MAVALSMLWTTQRSVVGTEGSLVGKKQKPSTIEVVSSRRFQNPTPAVLEWLRATTQEWDIDAEVDMAMTPTTTRTSEQFLVCKFRLMWLTGFLDDPCMLNTQLGRQLNWIGAE